ncbi:hypothetical protein J437_LFUL003679 [Ladona fulva]|uniref:Uncharacterized protein n=1 Tax=Ladona fulva TaxID=123851 RepID=A0A8K0JW22_LADFU|nr:hypothetical protein J437_LFUL003679 [Ladona fulva]
MVKLHVKKGEESQFLFETFVESDIANVITEVTTIFNGRLKVGRVCNEIECLAKHGTCLPPNMMGLTEEQVLELKLIDEWGDKCIPSGGYTLEPDPLGRRNGKKPNEKMQDVLNKTVSEAKAMTSKVIEPALSQLWFSGKEMLPDKKLKDYVGKNEKTKVVVKIQKRGHGAPSREPVMTEEERKEWMARAYHRQEELKVM